MNVDFNNLRKQAMFSYNRLCRRLNNARTPEGDVVISVEDIQNDMDNLRMQLSSICCSYLENDPEVKDLSKEIEIIEDFNPEK